VTEQTEKEFGLQRVYLRDVTFESPQAPQIFTTDRTSQIDLKIGSESRNIDSDTVEVTLTVTLRSFEGEETFFFLEIAQAGIFVIRGFTPEERFAQLATECRHLLHSYARVAVSEAINRGGFPDVLLQPMDFHGLYARKAQDAAAALPS